MTILLHRCDGPSPPRKVRSVRPWAHCRDMHWNSRSGRARDGCLIAEAGPTGCRLTAIWAWHVSSVANGTSTGDPGPCLGWRGPARTLRVPSRDLIEFLYPTGLRLLWIWVGGPLSNTQPPRA